jgi:thiol-disulfide isomerase/thioredoxin
MSRNMSRNMSQNLKQPPRRVAAALGVALLLAACSSDGERGSGSGYVAGDGTVNVLPAKDRPEPVSLKGTTLDGQELDVTSLRGKPVVVNVWASWCPPCREEAKDLQAAHTQLEGAGKAAFVGINYRDDPDGARAFIRSKGITYPSLVDDGDGSLLLALRGAVSPSSLPTTLVLDGQGRIAARVSGAVTTDTVVGLVDDVIKGESKAQATK